MCSEKKWKIAQQIIQKKDQCATIMDFSSDKNGHAMIELQSSDGGRVTVYAQGAHITSWRNAHGEERLYMSPNAIFEAGKPLRGGVPLIWPQFNDMGKEVIHGVARRRVWGINKAEDGCGVFSLQITEQDKEISGFTVLLAFEVRFSSSELKMTLTVTNQGTAPTPQFRHAFHTYFAVPSVRTDISGLDSSRFANNLKNRQVFDSSPRNKITEETDLIFFNVDQPVTLQWNNKSCGLVIAGENLPDVVLWNPHAERCKKISDLPPDGYLNYICVEHAVIEKPIVLEPRASWNGSQIVKHFNSLSKY